MLALGSCAPVRAAGATGYRYVVSYSGRPEGQVDAAKGTLLIDELDAELYIKTTAQGVRTGWKLFATGAVDTSSLVSWSAVSDAPYDSSTWNGSTNLATRNVIRDEVEYVLTLIPAINATDGYVPYRVGPSSFGDTPLFRINSSAMGFGSTNKFINKPQTSSLGLGVDALNSLSGGTGNTMVGWHAGQSLTTGGGNVGVGASALGGATAAGSSVAVGGSSQLSALDGQYNTSVGSGSLSANQSGWHNTAIGVSALSSATADQNVAVGSGAGSSVTSGFGNVLLGYASQLSAGTDQNEIVIGSGATGKGNNTATIGNSSVVDIYLPKSIYNYGFGLASANYERGQIKHSGNSAGWVFDSQAGGTGGYRDINFNFGGTNRVNITPTGSVTITPDFTADPALTWFWFRNAMFVNRNADFELNYGGGAAEVALYPSASGNNFIFSSGSTLPGAYGLFVFQNNHVTVAKLTADGAMYVAATVYTVGSGFIYDLAGSGSPEGVVTATKGSTYRRSDGGAGTSFYVKESGIGNTGWAAK